MDKYRSYAEVKEILKSFNIEFTGRAQKSYRQSSSAFASRARYWSSSRLSQELQYLIEKNVRRDRYQNLRKQNVSVKDAKKAVSLGDKRFKNYKEARKYFGDERARNLSKNPTRLQEVLDKVKYQKDRLPRIRDRVMINERDNVWAYWASIENYPSDIEDLAYMINEDRFNLDPDANPGWAIAYYHYKYNIDTDKLIERTNYDQFMPESYVVILQGLLG